jgi:hypothetical protein
MKKKPKAKIKGNFMKDLLTQSPKTKFPATKIYQNIKALNPSPIDSTYVMIWRAGTSKTQTKITLTQNRKISTVPIWTIKTPTVASISPKLPSLTTSATIWSRFPRNIGGGCVRRPRRVALVLLLWRLTKYPRKFTSLLTLFSCWYTFADSTSSTAISSISSSE